MSLATYPKAMPTEKTDTAPNILCAVVDEGRIAVVRVLGRGNFGNSLPLKNFAGHVTKTAESARFVVDLADCESMDSTFMGTLAGICILQTQRHAGRTIVVNANEHCQRLLRNLGLTHLLELRSGPVQELQDAEGVLQPAAAEAPTRLEQICLTLQAHKDLVRVDGQNEMRFQGVIEYLQQSLDKEKGGA